MESDDRQGGFVVHVYSPGNQIIQTQTNNYYGTVYQQTKGNAEQNGFTDEQIAKALTAIVGKGKPIDMKWKWAGAYWYLRWACNFPVDVQAYCKRVAELPYGEALPIDCEYNNIRRQCLLSFMDCDPRKMDSVKYSRNDQTIFLQCREIVAALASELGKTSLPMS